QVPPGVTAATAISFLQEQDESMLSTTFNSIDEGFEKIGYQTLCYIKQYWDTPRIVKVVGRDQQFNVIAFQGSSLRDNTDIRIEAGSALPTSKAAKQALLMDLMSQGFIPPEKGLELMEVGGVQRRYEEIQIDSAQASRENMKMSAVTEEDMEAYLQTFMGVDPITQEPQLVDPNTGQPMVDEMGQPLPPPLIVPVNTYDNHQIHIQVHNNYRKGQEYEQLPQQVKELFEAHVNEHMMALGLIPGVPAPMEGANAITPGEAGSDQTQQIEAEMAGGAQQQQEMPPEQMPPGMPQQGPVM